MKKSKKTINQYRAKDSLLLSKYTFLKAVKTTSYVIVATLSLSAFLSHADKYGRNIDKRLVNGGEQLAPLRNSATQIKRMTSIHQAMPDANVEFNQYGVTSSLVNPAGNIMAGAGVLSQIPELAAREFIAKNVRLLGLLPSDIQSMELTDTVQSISGTKHLYFGQLYEDIPVYNAQLQVHVTEQGAIAMVNNSFVSGLENAVKSMSPKVSAKHAIMSAANELNLPFSTKPKLHKKMGGVQQAALYTQSELSPQEITAKLVLIQTSRTNVALAWNFQFDMERTAPDVTVDALTGELITSFDIVEDATYNVFGNPAESPIHITPAFPADGRTRVVNPEDSTASPQGWFDAGTQTMDGNNVHACADRNADNRCDSGQPQCVGLVCDFPLNFRTNPTNSLNAAIANLFFWNNLVHDVQYQYGFDEAAGNFQENNFGRGGAGSDSVNAEAQDGSRTCNADFRTPADGGNPRMQMYLCDTNGSNRDSSFDNGVVVHEYGHGISTRQVGGPRNSSCLRNRQQGGEGWSDFFALVYTAKASDRAGDPRGLGGFFTNRGVDGSIRPQRYSINPAINNYTYESINGLSVPHGVGSVWAQALWEVYWTLVDEHGFEADLLNFDINDAEEAGNKRALFYVNEGLKNTACSPSFVDARNGVITAVTNSFGGADVCRVWEAFAGFGLGVNAVSGGSDSTRPRNGFELPAICSGPSEPTPEVTCADGSKPLYLADFETTVDGWQNGSSSCRTGTFVRGTPGEQINSGVTTQVGGAANGSGAWFTSTNTSAGVNDVDAGTCSSESAVLDFSGEGSVEISLSYFHGQRDAGDDADDGFNIEIFNNGTFATSMVSIGDVRSQAAWTAASSIVDNPGNIQIKVSATDGASAGDLVEAGIDKVQVCRVGAAPN